MSGQTTAEMAFRIWAAIASFAPALVMGVAAALARRRVDRRALSEGKPVSLVTPLHGRRGGDSRRHATLLAQNYRPLELVFVTEAPNDSALSAATEASLHAPVPVSIVTNAGRIPQGHGKAKNMIAAWHATSSPIVAYCDADLELRPDDLGACVAALEADPAIGAAYAPVIFVADDLPGRLASQTATIDGHALILASAHFRCSPFLLGGLMVLRRSAVEEAGGIECVADALADDARLRRVLGRAAREVRVADCIIVHRSVGDGWRGWASRSHRWMLGQRHEAALHFWTSLICHPFAVPCAYLAAAGPGPDALVIILGGIAARIASSAVVSALLLRQHGVGLGLWCFARPLAELAHLASCVAAVAWPFVRWHGRTYVVSWRGRVRSRARLTGTAP